MIGKLSDELLKAVLETLPIEFSVLDANDKVVGWNKHETRIFKRPEGVIGKDVRNCHPKKSLDKVEHRRSLLKSFPIRSVGKLRPQSYDAGAHHRPIKRAKRYVKDNR